MTWPAVLAAFLVCHLAGDLLLQTEWQALTKVRGLGDPEGRRALMAHVLTYMLPYLPVLVWIGDERGVARAVVVALLIALPHVLVDDGRLRGGVAAPGQALARPRPEPAPDGRPELSRRLPVRPSPCWRRRECDVFTRRSLPTLGALDMVRDMLGLPDGVTACLFDLDGVLTQTAKVHDRAWKQTFDEYLKARAEKTGEPFKEFDPDADYNEYVDGKPRYDGVRSFLQSRGIELPEGTPDDPPDAETICGIGNRKNDLVLKLIKEDGVEPYEGSVRYAKAARDAGLRRAVVSSSANCKDVLVAAGIEDLFEARVDGHTADERAPQGQARPRHVPGRRPRARRAAGPRGGVRGRGGGRAGRPRRRVRVRGGRRPASATAMPTP